MTKLEHKDGSTVKLGFGCALTPGGQITHIPHQDDLVPKLYLGTYLQADPGFALPLRGERIISTGLESTAFQPIAFPSANWE